MLIMFFYIYLPHGPNKNTTLTFKLNTILCFLLSHCPQLTKGCVAEILFVFMPNFNQSAAGLQNQTTKAQFSPLHHVCRNLKLTLSILLLIVIHFCLDKLESA